MPKSDAVWIGSLKYNMFKVGNINWKLAPNNTVKILGVTFSPSISIEMISCNWENKMNKIECSIRAWKMRGLSMIGRNLIVKTLLASQLSYLAPILSFPEKTINELNTMFMKFIWNRGEAVKRNTIIGDIDKGGLNVFNVKLFFDSLKLNWVKKLNDPEVACWKNIPLYHVNKFGIGLNAFNFKCTFDQINNDVVCKGIINSFPDFYYKLLNIWFNSRSVFDKTDISIQQDQIIWNNCIVSKNKKTFFYRDLINSGFILFEICLTKMVYFTQSNTSQIALNVLGVYYCNTLRCAMHSRRIGKDHLQTTIL